MQEVRHLKILMHFGHPAHYHLFKNLIKILERENHKIKVLSTDKEMLNLLLSNSKLNYTKIANESKGFFKIINFFKEILYTLIISRKYKPDVFVGRAQTNLAIASLFRRKPFVSYSDTDDAFIPRLISIPLSSVVVTPNSYTKSLGVHHKKFDGYYELCYLHGKYFKRKAANNIFSKKESVMVRFVSWGASHDIGKKGITNLEKLYLLYFLSKHYKVYLSSEIALPKMFYDFCESFDPLDAHQILSKCKLYVGEGATMASEAACLGVPSVFVSDRELGYINELRDNYKLIFQTNSLKAIIKTIKLHLSKNSNFNKENWFKMLEEKVDVNDYMYKIIINYGK